MPTIIADYGYDVHTAEVNPDIVRLIADGLSVQFEGQGFMHEEFGAQRDLWSFDGRTNTLLITVGEGFEQTELIVRDYQIL